MCLVTATSGYCTLQLETHFNNKSSDQGQIQVVYIHYVMQCIILDIIARVMTSSQGESAELLVYRLISVQIIMHFFCNEIYECIKYLTYYRLMLSILPSCKTYINCTMNTGTDIMYRDYRS